MIFKTCSFLGRGRRAAVAATSFLLCAISAFSPSAGLAAVKIMPLGDSLTRGNNDINYPNGDIPGGYRKVLGTRLANAGVAFDFIGTKTDNAAAGMDPDHEGYPGWRTDELLARLPVALALQPDTVLLMAGTNDVLQNVPVSIAATNLGNMIEQICGSAPARRLFVATIPPVTQSWQGVSASVLNANVVLYNQQVRNLVAQHAAAGRKVFLADVNASLVLTNPDPAKNFFQPGDGIHPGQAGYDQLGALWFDAIHTGGPMVDVPDGNLPVAPTGLTVSVASPSRINLTWTDNAANESVFRIRMRPLSGGAWREIAVLPADSTRHAVTGLKTGLEGYAFTVIAANSRGDSAWADIVVSNAPGDRAHAKPALASSAYSTQYAAPKANDGSLGTLWASANSGGQYWQVDLAGPHHIQQIRLITRQDADVAVHRKNFEIRASNDPAFASYTVLGIQGAEALPFRGSLVLDVPVSTPFRYVRVVKTDGASFSICLTQVAAADWVAVPEAPSDPIASALDATHAKIAWTVRSSTESGFKLERKTGPQGTYQEIGLLPAGTSSWVDSGLSAGTSYFYRVRAANESGSSAYSAEAAVTTGAATGIQAWAAAYPDFLALPPADQADSADANGDGLENLLAYAFGLDPLARVSSSDLPRMHAAPFSNTFFRFRRNKAAPDLLYEVLVSGNLNGDWSAADLNGATVSDVVGEPGIEEVSVPVLLPPGETKRFFRLKVTRVSP